MKKGLLIIQILLIAVLLGVVGAILFQKLGQKDSTEKEQTKNSKAESADDLMDTNQGTENLIMLGENEKVASGQGNYVMLCHVDYEKSQASMVTIYRDTLLEIPGKGKGKIVDAYELGGIELLQETIAKNFGLDITNYAVINFQDKDTVEALYDAAMKHDEAQVASLADDMLSHVTTNTSTEHVRKWINALGRFELTSSSAYPARFYGGSVDGLPASYYEVPVSLQDMAKDLHQILLGEDYSPSEDIISISDSLLTMAGEANNQLPE